MKITAFALFCILFGSFGHYPPPTEKIQEYLVTSPRPPRSVSSQTEAQPMLVFFTNINDNLFAGEEHQQRRHTEYEQRHSQTLSVIGEKEESVRPGFARREHHRAIRSKSGHTPGPAHSGLSATIPGRIYPLDSLLFTKPMLVFFTNMTDNQFASDVGEEHQQRQTLNEEKRAPRSVSPQTETLTDSVVAEVCLSSEEKKLYDLIMAYRKSKRLPPIPYSAKLSKVAQTHVRDLETNYNYENASTCNPHSWSSKGTWTSCCYTSDHKQASCMWTKPKEIAAYEGYGYEIAYYSSAGANASEGLEGWKKSPGHNPLIVNTGTWNKVKWQAIGIGIYGQYGVVWFGEEADESKIKLCK